MVLAEWQVGQLFWSMLWFTLFFLWIWLLIAVFADIFRSQDLGGWGKALWCIFVIVLPYLGVFVYLIARGGKMRDRQMQDATDAAAAQRAYIRQVAGSSPSTADELAKLSDMKATGAISEAEYEAAKAKVLS